MILSFGVPQMPYNAKNPQDLDLGYSGFVKGEKGGGNMKSIQILRIFRIVGHPRDPKGEDHGYLTTFRGINAPKSGPFKYENNAQTLPKQL